MHIQRNNPLSLRCHLVLPKRRQVKPIVDRLAEAKAAKHHTLRRSLELQVSLSEITLTARHHTSYWPMSTQVSPGGITLSARRQALQTLSNFVAIAWRFKPHHHALHQYSETYCHSCTVSNTLKSILVLILNTTSITGYCQQYFKS